MEEGTPLLRAGELQVEGETQQERFEELEKQLRKHIARGRTSNSRSQSTTRSDTTRDTVRLVDAAQRGDRQAVEDLFSRYLPRVQQIVALRVGRRLRQSTGVEDITQDVLLKAYRDLERCTNASAGSFRNWLAKAVENEVASQARKLNAIKRGGGKDRKPLSSTIVGISPTPSEVAQSREKEERIKEALIALAEHHWKAIVLRSLRWMSFQEIASEMGLRTGANARKAFSRARAKLLERLKED